MGKACTALALAGVLLGTLGGCHAPKIAEATNRSLFNDTLHEEVDPVPSTRWPINALSGHWEGDAWRINSRGRSHIIDHLEISSDEYGLLTVTRNWKTLVGEGSHKGRTPVNDDSEELVGVFNPVNGEFRMVEMDEPGTISGYLVDKDTIKFYSTQPGRQPSISLERLSRIPAP